MIFKENLYFDSNSYYPPNKKIIKKIFDLNDENSIGFKALNPSSVHSAGQFAHKILEDAREFILGLLTSIDLEDKKLLENIYKDCNEKSGAIQNFIAKNRSLCSFFDLIFFSSSSETNNFIIENAFKFLDCDLFLCSACEHASVIEKFASIKKKKEVHIINVNQFGQIDENQLIKILKDNLDKKIFLSLIYVNNETGVKTDLQNLVPKLRQVHNDLLIHSDFSQAVGKIAEINIAKMNLDFISFCGYKFGGLNGSACLIYRKKFNLKPILIGGGQENFKRAGTENVISIYSLHKVLEEIYDSGPNVFEENYNQLMNSRDYFEKELRKFISQEDLMIFGLCKEKNQRLIPTSYFAFKKVKAKKTIIFLDHFGISVGSGSACSAGLDVESSVLKAMQIPKEFSECAIRISFSESNSIDDVNFLLQRLKVLYSKI